MTLIVRIPSAELERLGDWAPRFHLVDDDASVTEYYEARLDRSEIDALCTDAGYACAIDDDGMGEIRDGDRVVARVRTLGRIL